MTRLKAHLCLREVQGLGDVTPREFDVAAELLARLVRKLHQRERGGTVHVADARVRVADGSPYPLPVRACQEADTRTRGHEDVAYQQNRNRAEQATAMATPTRSSMWRHSGARPCAAARTRPGSSASMTDLRPLWVSDNLASRSLRVQALPCSSSGISHSSHPQTCTFWGAPLEQS